MTSTSRCQTTYSPNLKESRFEPPPSAVWSRLRPPGSTRDTHVFLWAIAEDLRLTATHRRIYLNGATELWLSVASMWEVLIESGLGKLDVPLPAAPWLTKQIETNRVSLLPIRPSLLAALETLPPMHRDPFERMLIAQANAEGLTILTGDTAMRQYGSAVI